MQIEQNKLKEQDDMMPMELTKTKQIFSKNAAYQKFEVLLTNRNKRHKYNEFIAEGVRNINEAIRNNWEIVSFIYSHESELSHWAVDILNNQKTAINYGLTSKLMSDLSSKDETSELMAILKMKGSDVKWRYSNPNPIFALFDRPSNKGNLGTMLRSCDAFGVEQLIITGHSVDIYEPDVITSSTGSFFNVPFIRLSENTETDNYIASLKLSYPQLKIIGTSDKANAAIYETDMTMPILIMMGNERSGLSKHYRDVCDELAAIPINAESSASSLNVSCAATTVFYEVIRQRNTAWI